MDVMIDKRKDQNRYSFSLKYLASSLVIFFNLSYLNGGNAYALNN